MSASSPPPLATLSSDRLFVWDGSAWHRAVYSPDESMVWDGAVWRLVPDVDARPLGQFMDMVRDLTIEDWVRVWGAVSGWPDGLDIATQADTLGGPAVPSNRSEYWDSPLWEGQVLQAFVYGVARTVGLTRACSEAAGSTLDAIWAGLRGQAGPLRIEHELIVSRGAHLVNIDEQVVISLVPLARSLHSAWDVLWLALFRFALEAAAALVVLPYIAIPDREYVRATHLGPFTGETGQSALEASTQIQRSMQRVKSDYREMAQKLGISQGRVPYIQGALEPGWAGGTLPPPEEAFGRVIWGLWEQAEMSRIGPAEST